MRNTRLPGHALQHEGKPYERRKGRWQRAYFSRGRALCECGEASEVLATDGRRKAWHRDHKEQIRNA